MKRLYIALILIVCLLVVTSCKEETTFKAEWKVNEKSVMFESPKLYNETG